VWGVKGVTASADVKEAEECGRSQIEFKPQHREREGEI
jgi:hypothetical protein